MRSILALLALATITPALAQEPSRTYDDSRGQLVGFVPKPYTAGGPLPKYCTREEWDRAITVTVAETKDIPIGQTAEFIRRANAVAARFGC